MATLEVQAGDTLVGATGLQGDDAIDNMIENATFAAGSTMLDQSTIEDDGAGRARVKDAGVTHAKLATRAGSMTKAEALFFHVRSTANQTITKTTETQVQFATEVRDDGSRFASHKYTPNVAGIYTLVARVTLNPTVAGSTFGAYLMIRKNGTAVTRHYVRWTDNGRKTLELTTFQVANGTTDYFDVSIYHDYAASVDTDGSSVDTVCFMGGLMYAD